MGNFGDFNMGIYFDALTGRGLEYPVTHPGWEARAAERLDPVLYDYVAGGAGDESTQRANLTAFERWSVYPRMLSGAADRDLSIELFGQTLPTPLLMAPIGVVGIMADGGHGDTE